jgi:lysylphosphatidylglycerol synthetase-like protein (DUF2156 family)
MSDVPLETRTALIRQFGSFSQAYSVACQPGLSYFGDERGFIAYKMVGRTAMALADPVAAAGDFPRLISDFVAEFRDVVFCQTSRRVVEILAGMQFMVNEMGIETTLDLPDYTFRGHAKEHLRRANNRMVKIGYDIREAPLGEVGRDAVEAVSGAWRKIRTMRRRTLSFLLRPIVFDDEPDVRKFYAFDRNGATVAFVFFDPVYSGGRIIGYTDQFRRRLPAADPKVNYAITYRAIETFKQEGLQRLFLGLSPFAEIHDPEFPKNWLVRRGFRFCYESALFNYLIYPLKGHHVHKSRYGGAEAPSYFAFNTLPSLPRLIKLLRACNII